MSAALQALDGAPLAHLAAHGHHDQENFLFSRLDLADGPLMAYDIQQLAAAPRHVVLSSCDVGRTVVRPGEEILGFTAALLYIGTATVTASVTRVGDDDAVGTMTAYHRLLAAGTRPAEALAGGYGRRPVQPVRLFRRRLTRGGGPRSALSAPGSGVEVAEQVVGEFGRGGPPLAGGREVAGQGEVDGAVG